jgi:[ribosomal protein S5]-alanine N-acetyltransferase
MLKLIEIDASGRPVGMTPLMPPEAREVLRSYKSLYESVPHSPPWTGYLVETGGELVGSCGFKSPPENGRVEISYYTFEKFEQRGIGTWMARQLVAIAREQDPGLSIVAQTQPYESPSTLILRKVGFEKVGVVEHPEDGKVWEWRYTGASVHTGGAAPG